MDKIITLAAGEDKLVIQQNSQDWCPVFVVTASGTRLLGKEGWKLITTRLLEGIKKSYMTHEATPQCVFLVSDPHGAMFIQKDGNQDNLLFKGIDAPHVFHAMKLSQAEKQEWLETLQKVIAQ